MTALPPLEPSRATAAVRDASARAASDASCGTGGTRRICAWCRGPIPAAARRDAVCCSVRCRQARHRFLRTVGRAAVAGGRALRLAYADPPYPGNSRLYRGHPDYAGEVDHAALIRRLRPYDGWALSTSAAALPVVLAVCPPGVRVAAWHRGERPTASWRPLSAWEPVIYYGGRLVDPASLPPERRTDSLVHGVSPLTSGDASPGSARRVAFVADRRDASARATCDGSAVAVNAAHARETAPEPGNRSSRVSPAAAPSRLNTHRQNAAGLVPITRPGSVVLNDASCPTSHATADDRKWSA